MATNAAIDAQFDRAVEIVQSLPKTGPIQTGYEEKLTMYSLYKQATVGNVEGPRPGMWDMLGRAKWDAWAQHKELKPVEAKFLYVEALLKVLRKYSDKTVARDFVREIESYGGEEPADAILSTSISRASSESTGSTSSLPPLSTIHLHAAPPNLPASPGASSSPSSPSGSPLAPLPTLPSHHHPSAPITRTQSTLSSSTYPTRYRTAPPTASTPSSVHTLPALQPHPGYETPSAFGPSSPTTTYHHNIHPVGSYVYVPQTAHPTYPLVRAPSAPLGGGYSQLPPAAPLAPQRAGLELVIQRMQAHLAALSERLDALESTHPGALGSPLRSSGSRSPAAVGRRDSPTSGDRPGGAPFDPDELGFWAIVVKPAGRAIELLAYVLRLVLFPRPDAGPAAAVARRLALDASFVLACAWVFRVGWRRSGRRRREVRRALGVLWAALAGSDAPGGAVRAIGAAR